MVRAGLRFVGVVYLAQVRSTYGLHAVYPICILAGSPHRFYSVHPRSIPRPVGPSSRPSMQHAETRLKRLSVEVISCLLVQRFDLEQVTLFSSSACAESDENSDLDLLVVRPVAQAARSMGPRIAGNTSKPSDHPAATTPSTAPSPTISTSPPTSSSFLTKRSPGTARTPTPCSAECWNTPKSSTTATRREQAGMTRAGWWSVARSRPNPRPPGRSSPS